MRKETGAVLVVMPHENRPMASSDRDELFEIAGNFYQIMPALIKSTTFMREVMSRTNPLPFPGLHNEMNLRRPMQRILIYFYIYL